MKSNRRWFAKFLPPLIVLAIIQSLSAPWAHAQDIQVDLSSTSSLCGGQACFNAAGLYNDGVLFFGENFMDGGTECTPIAGFTTCPAAFGAQQLFGSTYNPSSTTPPTLTISNVPFTFGLVNAANCAGPGESACIDDMINLTTSGTTVTLPAAQQGVYSTAVMLGTAVQGHHAGKITFTYDSGSPVTVAQTLSDWCGFGSNANESLAVGGFERIVANGTTIGPNCNLYAYTYSLDTTRNLVSVSLVDADGSGFSFALAITLKPTSYVIEGGTATPATISTGSSSTATVTVTPQPGYMGDINLSCTISPAIVGDPPSAATAPSCSITPTTVSIMSGETAPPTTMLTFTAAKPGNAMAQGHGRIFYAFWLPLPGLALLGFGLRNSPRKKILLVLLTGVLLGALVSTPACVSTVNLGNVGTPPGQYTVTITGVDAKGLSQASNQGTGTTNTVVVTVTGN